MGTTPVVVLLICIWYFDSVIRCGPYPQVPVRFLKKKNQIKSLIICSLIPELGSDPPIGSDRESGCDIFSPSSSFNLQINLLIFYFNI